MRGQTLSKILDDVRIEAKLSLNPAHNVQVRDQHVGLIQREQERLWLQYDWPHLRVERFIATQAGQRFYDPPADMLIDRIEKIEFKSSNQWIPVDPDITSTHYNRINSELGQTGWPVSCWRVWESEQIEIWPIPNINANAADQNGYLKIIGYRNLTPLVADDDRSDLDGYMVALYVASILLAASKKAEAQITLEAAKKLEKKLTDRLTKRRRFQMFDVGNYPIKARPRISRYVVPTNFST